MEREEIISILKDGITTCAHNQDWANLAELGTFLRQRGIKYGKLSRYLEDYKDVVETKIDESVTPPAVYARLLK